MARYQHWLQVPATVTTPQISNISSNHLTHCGSMWTQSKPPCLPHRNCPCRINLCYPVPGAISSVVLAGNVPSSPCVSNCLSSLWFQCVASCHQKNTFTLAKTPQRTEKIFLMPSFLWSDRSKYTVWCSPVAILVVFKLLANTAKLVPAVSWGAQSPGIMVRFIGTATTRNTKADLGTYRDWVYRHPGYMYLYSPLWLSR